MTSTPLVVLDACVFANFELRAHFAEAWISDYEPLISRVANDEKDRHVLAAAAHGQASIILTMNLRHFRPEHLKPWGIRALHPQSFLNEIFREEQMLVVKKLEQQAADRAVVACVSFLTS